MKKLFVLLFLLAGCAQTTEQQWSIPAAPVRGKAQIVVYQPHSMKITSTAVDLNGGRGCDITSGGYFVLNVPSGPQTLSASIWDMPGTSRLTINAKAGQRYYVRFGYDVGKGMAFGAFGIPGVLAAEGASDKSGPFFIDVMEENVALADLRSLHAMGCQGG